MAIATSTTLVLILIWIASKQPNLPVATATVSLIFGLTYGASTLAIVSFRLRQRVLTIDLTDIAVMFGIVLLDPIILATVAIIVSFVVRLLIHRQSFLRGWANSLSSVIQGLVAYISFWAVLGSAPLESPKAIVAVLAAAFFSTLAAAIVITFYFRVQGDIGVGRQLAIPTAFAMVAAVVTCSTGYSAVLLFEMRPLMSLLLLFPASALYFAYRGYGRSQIDRLQTEGLYQVVQGLHAATSIEEAITTATTLTAQAFNCQHSAIYLFDQDVPGRAQQSLASRDVIVHLLKPTIIDTNPSSFWHTIRSSDEPAILPSSAITSLENMPDFSSVLVAPIRFAGKGQGVIAVTRGIDSPATFDNRDEKALAAIARHVATAIENGRLEASLKEAVRLRDQLEDLNRTKDQFVATLSHELRSPLSAVVGLIAELSDPDNSFGESERMDLLRLAHNNGSDLSDLVEDLLVMARTEIGNVPIRLARFAIDEAVGPVLEVLAHREPTGRIETTIENGSLEIASDPIRFRQIVRNLLTNAVRYGGDRIWMSVQATIDGMVEICVRDNGEGIPEELTERVFEAYQTGSHNHVSGSVGLGLAVSRHLARLMGGNLVYRREDEISAFVLTSAQDRRADIPASSS